MKVKVLLAMVVSSTLMLGGCARKPLLQPDTIRETSYIYDNSKSYAYNMLAATTTEKLCVNDSPLQHNGDTAKIGSAALVGYGALTSNSLSAFGVSSGASAGLGAALILLGPSKKIEYSPGMSSLMFGWIPKQEKTRDQVIAEIEAAIYLAALEAVKSTSLPDGYSYSDITKRIAFDKKGIYIIGVDVRVSGKYCNAGGWHCSYSISNAHCITKSVVAPEALGGKDSWFFIFRLSNGGSHYSASHPPKRGMGSTSLNGYDFYETLSEGLPENYFIYIAPNNKYSRFKTLEIDGLKSVKIPVLFNQGQTHLFTPNP